MDQRVVVIAKTGRVRRHGFTEFEGLPAGELVLVSGVDYQGIVTFDPGINEAEWYYRKGKEPPFVMKRALERDEVPDWEK